MSSNFYECAVLNCINTSANTYPSKLFIKVPPRKPNREIWLNLAKRNPKKVASNSKLYICEDHFDIKNDMINYMEYKIMGSVKAIRMKRGCVPTKFDSKTDEVQIVSQPCSAGTAPVSYDHEYTKHWKRLSHKSDNKQPKIKMKLKKVTHGIYEHDRSNDVEDKIEPCSFEETFIQDLIKKENIINKTENSYNREVKELTMGPKIIQDNKRNKSEYKDVVNKDTEITCYNHHSIKEEVLFESDAAQDEDVNVFDGDNNVIKQELVVKSEIINNHDDIMNQTLKIEVEEVNITEDYNECIDIEIKEEADLEDVNLCIKSETEVYLDENNILYSDDDQRLENEVDNLYKDHIVKDEIVVGPECIQEISVLPKVKDIDDQTKLSCHICGQKFTFETNLKRHLTIHSGKKPFRCNICDSTFARKDYLQFHIFSYHRGIRKTPNIRPRSTCDLCNKEFSSKCSRDHHRKHSCPMNVNKEKKPENKVYACDICYKSYKYRSSLSAHITKCHTYKDLQIVPLHECDYCGKTYMKKHNLQCHIQWKHLNVSPYKCVICNETFTWYSTLATHERKMHSCDL